MLKHRIFITGLIGLATFMLLNLLPGCSENKSTRSLYIEFNLYGSWQEEYTIGYWQPSIFEWGEDVWVERDYISSIELKNDSYNLKIYDGHDSLLIEHSGDCRYLGDTIFFDVAINDSTIATNTLGYKFLSKDSLLLHSISYPVNDNYFTIELFGFAWQVPFGYDTMFMYGYVTKNSGIFVRQE
jgi:hypothetical protein